MTYKTLACNVASMSSASPGEAYANCIYQDDLFFQDTPFNDKLNEIVPEMVKEFKFKNNLMVPKVVKTVVNIGLGEALDSSNVVQIVSRDLQLITGQKPIERKAKKSIANFKLREGQVIGLSVTLRGDRMWFFLDNLLNMALPRVRDFRGVSKKSFDGNGNYSLGLQEQVIFPQIDYNEIDKLRGMQINIVTSSDSDTESRKLLELLGMPFES